MAAKRWLDLGSLSYPPDHDLHERADGHRDALRLRARGGRRRRRQAASHVGGPAGGWRRLPLGLTGRQAGRRADGRPRRLCALFLFSPFGIYSVMATSYAEGTATLAIVASTLCWMLWFDSSEALPGSGPAALLAGIAVTFKLTSVVFPVALGGPHAPHRPPARPRGDRHRRRRMGWVAGLAGLCVAPMLPWMIRSPRRAQPGLPRARAVDSVEELPARGREEFESYNRYMIWGTSWGYRPESRRAETVAGRSRTRRASRRRVVYWRCAIRSAGGHRSCVVGTTVVQLFAAGLYLRYWIPLAAVLQIPVLR